MLKILDRRVGGFQKDILEQRMRTEEFRDLLEDRVWQATRALTKVRRAHIASLLKNSLTSEDLAHAEEKLLLELLGQLKDPELLILGWLGSGPKYLGRQNEYFERHKNVLMNPIYETGMSEEAVRQETLKSAYRNNLRTMGLMSSGSSPRDTITPLGRLLLRKIDFYSLQG